MADRSSTLDPDNFPGRRKRKTLKGHDTKSLGPSDTRTPPPTWSLPIPT
jgi:hypothetical protein